MQTIWPALCARRVFGLRPAYQRERWTTPDADFVDVDWLDTAPQAAQTLLVLFHGLEGSSRSHYAEAFADFARERGMAYAVPHFRGCSGELNRGPRAYHSGDYEEIGWILQRMRQRHTGPIIAVGISLGGNALLRWAQEMGAVAAQAVSAVAAVCSPIDLAAGGRAIGRGFNRWVYTRMFLNTMKPKAMQKLAQHPGLFDGKALMAARDLYEFDNVFTAPLHGRAGRPSHTSTASESPRWWSMPATTPLCPLRACQSQVKWGRVSPYGNPSTAAMWDLRKGHCQATYAPCPTRWVDGWRNMFIKEVFYG